MADCALWRQWDMSPDGWRLRSGGLQRRGETAASLIHMFTEPLESRLRLWRILFSRSAKQSECQGRSHLFWPGLRRQNGTSLKSIEIITSRGEPSLTIQRERDGAHQRKVNHDNNFDGLQPVSRESQNKASRFSPAEVSQGIFHFRRCINISLRRDAERASEVQSCAAIRRRRMETNYEDEGSAESHEWRIQSLCGYNTQHSHSKWQDLC